MRKNIWERWAAIIYHYPKGNNDDEYETHRQFVAKAYNNAPNRIIELLKREIESDTENKSYWSFEKLRYCWDEKLKSFLKDELKNLNLSVYGIRKILSKLFELNDAEASKISCDFIKFPIPDDKKEQEVLMIAVELLISYGKISCWEKIWQIVVNNPEFGTSMIEYGCFRFRREGEKIDLSEKQLADLYLWLSEKYPHKDDPVHYGSYSPSFRDTVKDWRESILSTLVEKGNAESVSQVKRVKDNLPQVEWLKRTVLRAEEKMRTASWQPLSTQQLLELFFLNDKTTKQFLEDIERKIDLVSSRIDNKHQQMMEQFANLAFATVQNEVSKLNEDEKEQFEEVKKGKWETKLKFVIPLIPKIPILGEFFPSASMEVTKNIESGEYINFVQKKLYGEKLQTNIFKENNEQEDDKFLLKKF